MNILNPLHAWPKKASYELRLGKYAHRGFAVLIPGLVRKRIANDVIRCNDLCQLKGLARLVKVCFEMEASIDSSYPRLPDNIEKLRGHIREIESGDERLINGHIDYGDEEVHKGVGQVWVPSVYADDTFE